VVKGRQQSTVIFAEKETIVRTAERAGYRLVHEYDFLPKHTFLEFEATQPADTRQAP
jgi:hypothetical protein